MPDEDKSLVPEGSNLPSDQNLTEADESAIRKEIEGLTKQIIHSSEISETTALIDTFNAYLAKKNAIRTYKLDGLYDNIIEQMILRFKHRSGEFSNQDLLNYLDKVESAIEKSSAQLSKADEKPVVKVNSTQVNINLLDSLSQDSKENIADAIKAVLASAQSGNMPENEEPPIPVDYEDTSTYTEDEDTSNNAEGEDNN